MALKWAFKQKVNIGNSKNLLKIIQFYLVESPVPDVSMKGKTFKELGWHQQGFLTLRSRMFSCSGLSKDYWVSCAASRMDEELKKIERLESYDYSFEFAVHTVKDGLNQTEALFYLIRNGLAHGGFRIGKYDNEKYYAFETRKLAF